MCVVDYNRLAGFIKNKDYHKKKQESRMTNEKFVMKAKAVHGDMYDYDL